MIFIQGLRYEVSPAIDANSTKKTKGRDSICSDYKKCSAGQYANFTGTKTEDKQCTPCKIGTYGTDGDLCNKCPDGKYSDVEGATSCKDCTDCSENGNGFIYQSNEWGLCPFGETCVNAYRR